MAGDRAVAVPIDTDLAISGTVGLNTSTGISFSDGNVSQSGQIRHTVGGTTTTGAFSTSPGTADGTNDLLTTPPPTNPLTGAFTDTGDGIGYGTDLDALFQAGVLAGFSEGYDFIVDLGMSLTNNSATDTFTIGVKVNYSNVADASANDSFAEGSLNLLQDAVGVLTSDVFSSSIGDQLNGVNQGTSGATISDISMTTINVVLAPGVTSNITGTHQWEGAAWVASSNSNIDISVDLTIDSIQCTGPNCAVAPPPPTPAPEPGTLFVIAFGLVAMSVLRRRQIATVQR